jgi:hypothetical protein
MSRNSKAKRDAKRKKAPKRFTRSIGTPIEPHGEMRDSDGSLIAGVGLQGEDWVLVIGDQVIGSGSGSNAADAMVMLDRIAELGQKEGRTVVTSYSPIMQAEAERAARAEGMTLDEYIAKGREELAEPEESADDGAEAAEK